MGEISRNTVNHLRSDKNACTECFRIVDAVFTKILRLQQLHMNLILVEDVERKNEFVEKQKKEYKYLYEDVRSLQKIMLAQIGPPTNEIVPILETRSIVDDNYTLENTRRKSDFKDETQEDGGVDEDFCGIEKSPDNESLPISEDGEEQSYSEWYQTCNSITKELDSPISPHNTSATVDANTEPTVNTSATHNADTESTETSHHRKSKVPTASSGQMGDGSDICVIEHAESLLVHESKVGANSPESVSHEDEGDGYEDETDAEVEEQDEAFLQNMDRKDLLVVLPKLPDLTPAGTTVFVKSSFGNTIIRSVEENYNHLDDANRPKFNEEFHVLPFVANGDIYEQFLIRAVASVDPPESTDERPTNEKLFECAICEKKFASKSSICAHMKMHTAKSAFDENKYMRTDNSAARRTFQCTLCEKIFAYKQSLKRHMPLHTGEKPYKCTLCGRTFTDPKTLVSHIRIHTGEKPYECAVCGYKCIQRSCLILHMRVHTGERPYKCTICERKCIDSSGLRKHMRIHSAEKRHRPRLASNEPVECTVCGKTVMQRCNLIRHMRKHTGEKPYKCSVCGHQCSQRHNLIQHIQKHSDEKPFECMACGRKFKHRSTLVAHLRVHTGEKPFKCTVCGNGFRQAGNLAMHMRKHAGEKPFRCADCGYECASRSGFILHIRKHVDEKVAGS